MNVKLIFTGNKPEIKKKNLLKKMKRDCEALISELELSVDTISENIEAKTISLASAVDATESSNVDFKKAISELVSLEASLETTKKIVSFKTEELKKIISEIDKM